MAGLPIPGNGRASSGRQQIPPIWRGTIVELYTDQTVAALVPSLYGDQAIPMPCVVAGLAVGDRVLIAAIEGRRDDLIVFAPG
ncbi:hypothetical protein Jinkies_26 [Arthrobacter phage Jinkies]|uniref:Uncharacterized protein n=1 Tax=Arthrobacter phage Jinkies TaxID=2743903 RepID=A0A7S5WX34_9CAUD|nr:hypothetical protein Jinkies_26 [Arthrobacter phage Jinkies]